MVAPIGQEIKINQNRTPWVRGEEGDPQTPALAKNPPTSSKLYFSFIKGIISSGASHPLQMESNQAKGSACDYRYLIIVNFSEFP